jgi:hypothetical protein
MASVIMLRRTTGSGAIRPLRGGGSRPTHPGARRRLRAVVAVIAATLVVTSLLVGPVAAAQPQPVSIALQTSFNYPDPNGGTFAVTSGGAQICPTGTQVDISFVGGGWPTDRNLELLITKRFTCDDGSGTFDLELQIHIVGPTERFTWVVKGGTGPYEHLHGTGSAITIYHEGNTYNQSYLTGFLLG